MRETNFLCLKKTAKKAKKTIHAYFKLSRWKKKMADRTSRNGIYLCNSFVQKTYIYLPQNKIILKISRTFCSSLAADERNLFFFVFLHMIILIYEIPFRSVDYSSHFKKHCLFYDRTFWFIIQKWFTYSKYREVVLLSF